jgi:tRNA(fMet)-specific endonuclease VapC
MILHYLLDTNTCIYIVKQKPPSVVRQFEKFDVGMIGMSIITYGELFYGAQKSHFPQKTSAILADLVKLIPVLSMPVEAGKHYGKIRSQLEKLGKPIGNNDLWIAAHALALDLPLVTNNVKEFKRISDLQVENWVD